MPDMGRYCKAYSLGSLRRFQGWSEIVANARAEEREIDGRRVLAPRPLADDSYVFLHDTLVVTDGVFPEENVIFNQSTAEWQEFCGKDLAFEPPAGE